MKRLAGALRELVAGTGADRPWEGIWFALRNWDQVTHTIALIDQTGREHHLTSTPEIDEIVSAVVALLEEPPQESWSVLNVEVPLNKGYTGCGDVIYWGAVGRQVLPRRKDAVMSEFLDAYRNRIEAIDQSIAPDGTKLVVRMKPPVGMNPPVGPLVWLVALVYSLLFLTALFGYLLGWPWWIVSPAIFGTGLSAAHLAGRSMFARQRQ